MKTMPFCLTFCIFGSAFAQDVPPPPKPAVDSPSLEVTMKYIQDRLNGEGSVTYRMTTQNVAGAIVSSNDTVDTKSNALADAGRCELSFNDAKEGILNGRRHWRDELVEKFSFRDVDQLVVESVEHASDRTLSLTGADQSFRVSPPIFQLRVVLNSGKTIHSHSRTVDGDGVISEKDTDAKEADFYFQEEDAAQRMAKAIVHAVELCGGGKDDNDPFK